MSKKYLKKCIPRKNLFENKSLKKMKQTFLDQP